MFESMKIPRKLGISFITICASAAAMMVVFWINIAMIHSSTDRNNFSQTVHSKELTLETAILRQNSQFRGYLVTGDDSYLKSYDEARVEYDHESSELERLLADPEKRQLLMESREKTVAWRKNWGDRLIAVVRNGQREEAQNAVRSAGKAVMVSDAVLPLRALRDAETRLMKQNGERQNMALTAANITLLVGGIMLIGVAMLLARLLGKVIARPITELTRTMSQLAAGNNGASVPDTDRRDELGDMARAVLVFRDAALAKLAADEDRQKAMAEIGDILHQLAEADLTVRLHGLPDAFSGLANDFNDATSRLSGAMTTVRSSVDTIKRNSAEIRQAAGDLSLRSEKQAAHLQETAAAMADITKTMQRDAMVTVSANSAMSEARREAEQGGQVVDKAIAAMNGIDQASKEIGTIIAVIEGIAFQTNLLALNAGVEAARAGDAGRGFAVVASEVRALAQRAADAATDVKSRVLSASDQVNVGVQLVDETGRALSRIIERVASVSDSISSMTESSERQAQSLRQVNAAIGEIDSVTQENAAMVEETTAASQTLASEAELLAQAFATFKVDNMRRPGMIAPPSRSRVTPARAMAVAHHAPVRQLRNTTATSMPAEDDWSEF
jgi:methyl-accepting chemotaxis protein